MYYQTSDVEVSLSNQIVANIEILNKNVYIMQKLVNQADKKSQLMKLQHTTNLLARDINNLIKDFAQLPHPANPSELRQRAFMRDRLTNDFSEGLRNFQVVQRAIKAVPVHSTGEVLIDIDKPNQEVSEQQQQQARPNLNLEDLREREESVRKLESDIVEVNHIFKDLATIIHNQGETVDSIESSIFRATEEVSRGATEIARARDYADRSRRKKFYLAMIFFIIMFVVLLIVFASN